MTLRKTDLQQRVAEQTGLNKAQAGRAVDAVLDTISSALASGDDVNLTGFGTFRVASTSPRTGRNPRTGESIQIAGGKRAAFRPGSRLRDAVSGGS